MTKTPKDPADISLRATGASQATWAMPKTLTKANAMHHREFLAMLSAHRRWLMEWNATDELADQATIRLRDYWVCYERAEGWETIDSPEWQIHATTGDDDLCVQIVATPFHDEGGPSVLTAWFERDDGMRWVNQSVATAADGRGMLQQLRGREPKWVMRHMTQQFDRRLNVIVEDGTIRPGGVSDLGDWGRVW